MVIWMVIFSWIWWDFLWWFTGTSPMVIERRNWQITWLVIYKCTIFIFHSYFGITSWCSDFGDGFHDVKVALMTFDDWFEWYWWYLLSMILGFNGIGIQLFNGIGINGIGIDDIWFNGIGIQWLIFTKGFDAIHCQWFNGHVTDLGEVPTRCKAACKGDIPSKYGRKYGTNVVPLNRILGHSHWLLMGSNGI